MKFDLLVQLAEVEDFVTSAGIQRGFETGAQGHLVFGRDEPVLIYLERSFDVLLASG